MSTINTVKTMCSVVLFFSLIGTSVFAQSQIETDKKEKRSALTFHNKLQNVKFSSFQISKAATDNDIGRAIEQWNDGDTWLDEYRATYSYSSDRRTITQNFEFFDFETEGWVDDGMISLTMNAEGYPLSVDLEYFEDTFTQTFFYAESGKLDSVKFEEIFDGEHYSEIIELIYVTEDSIRLKNTFNYDGETGVDESSYFLNKDGNFVEVYDYVDQDFIDRYTYYDISLNDYIKNIYNEFFFVEIYNDEFYDEEGWVPYSRTTLTTEGGVVTETLYEYYDDSTEEWINDTRSTIVYEDGKIIQINEAYSFDGIEWDEDYRTIYIYGAVTSNEGEETLAKSYTLLQNYPNPFNPTTQISYSIPATGKVLLEVYNVLGMKVATLVNGAQNAGEHVATFNASSMPSGIYYYRLSSGNYNEIRSMTLIK